MSPLLYARGILARHGIDAAWPPNAICIAVVARLPRSNDRKLFNGRAEGCGTHAELIELAAATLKEFEKRRTPLRPPPPPEDDGDPADEEEEVSEGARSPYLIR